MSRGGGGGSQYLKHRERNALKNAGNGESIRNGLFIQVLTFIKYLRIYIAGFGSATAGDIAGNINIFTLFPA